MSWGLAWERSCLNTPKQINKINTSIVFSTHPWKGKRRQIQTLNWGSTRVLCGIIKRDTMQLTLMLQCHGDYEIEMLQPQSHRGRETLPLQSQKSLPVSAQKVQIPEQRCQWKYRLPFSFTFQKHNILVVKVYLRLPPVIWNSNSTEHPVVLGVLLLLLNLTLPQTAWDGNFAGF